MIWVWVVGGIIGVLLLGWGLWALLTKSSDPAGASFLMEAIVEVLSAIAGGL